MKRQGRPVLEAALAALTRTTGLAARVVAPGRRHPAHADALLEIRAEGRTFRFVAEVRAVDRFETPAQVKRQFTGHAVPPLLVAPYITPGTAERCRNLRLAFMDTAGNAYLERPGLLVWVIGQERPTELKRHRFRALHPAGLQITFALLCRPYLVQATYRAIAQAANVALGTIGPVIRDLEARGFVRASAEGRRLLEPQRLLEEWVTHYHTALRTKLNPRRFEGDVEALEKADLEGYGACWGGEVAADRLTHMLQPATFTIYAREPIGALIAGQRLRARPGGRIEVLDIFWNLDPEPDRPGLVPPPLIYADLLATQDARNIEAAKLIYDQFIEPAFHSAH
jgi:hypothetical protein